jgi:RND family efflux transporter MFP subunit
LVTLLIAVAALQLVLIAYLVFFDGASPSGRSPDEQGPAAVPAAASADSRAPSGPRANATQLVAQGYVVAQRQATVSSRQLGVIKEIYVDEGDVVDKGQVLGQLDPRDAQIALRALQAELRVIEAETRSARAEQEQERSYLARYAALEERGFLSSHDRDLAQTRFEVARAKVASAVSREDYTREQIARARLQIDDLSIRAPFAGVVIERNAQPGEVLAPSGAGGGFTRTGLCTIVDMSSLQIVIDVNEQMITRVREGQRVEAELSAYRDLKVSGRVAQITPSADRARGTVRVRIQLLTEDPRILPDMAVKVRFL